MLESIKNTNVWIEKRNGQKKTSEKKSKNENSLSIIFSYIKVKFVQFDLKTTKKKKWDKNDFFEKSL